MTRTLIILALSCSVAGAIPPEKKRLYEEAAKLYARGQFKDAARAFEVAHLRFDDATFLFNAGRAWEKAGDLPNALFALEQFAQLVPNRAAPGRTLIQALEPRAQKKYGRLAVRVPRVDGAVVNVGGRQVAWPIWLSPGPVDILVEAPGYFEERRSVIIELGKRIALTIPMRPVPTTGSLVVTSEPQGAPVWLNGQRIGRTPIWRPDLEAGRYNVAVQDPEAAEAVEIVAGDKAVVHRVVYGAAPPEAPGAAASSGVVDQWWFWSLIGLGVAGAVTAGVLLGGPGESPAPAADWGTWEATP
jgi:tetratricopeptide (TPR) repeat protein